MKVSAIVVTYNRLSLLKECISCLMHQVYPLDHIFIVNNNSSDNTDKYLNYINNNNKIRAFNLHKNLGGAGGFNYGMKQAYKCSSSKAFWLMDDDAMPSKTALKSLLISAKQLHNHFGYLSSNVRLWSNDAPTNVPLTTYNWSRMISKSVIGITESTFVSLFVPRNIVTRIGFPLSQAFIWGDDTEYTDRISSKYPSYFVPDSIVYHKSKATNYNESIFNEEGQRISFYKYGYRNKLYIDRQYYPYKRVLKDIVGILIILCKIPFKARDHRFLRMYYVFIGLCQYFIFHPKIDYPSNNK